MTYESGALHSDFSELDICEPLKKGIKELGYISPTTFQKGIFDHFNHGKNVVGEGQSNYGKSLAFNLPILAKVKSDVEETQALIICESPLESDLTLKECKALGRHMGLTVDTKAPAQLVVCSASELSKIKNIVDFDSIETIFFDALSAKSAQKAISALEPLLSKDVQVLIFGQDTLGAFKVHAGDIIDNAVFVCNGDQPNIAPAAMHTAHQVKEDEPKARALLASMLLHKPKYALVSCNEASEAELLARYLTRYGFKCAHASEEYNRQGLADGLALLLSAKLDVFICQNSLLASHDLASVAFIINYDMIERPKAYEQITQFNKQAHAEPRHMVNLLTNRELGYLGPIKAQCLIDFHMQDLPSGEEVTSLAAKRMLAQISLEAEQIELGQFESLAQKLLGDEKLLPALAFLLRNHFLKSTKQDAPMPSQSHTRERSFERRRPEREERLARPRNVHSAKPVDEPSLSVERPLEASTRLYVSLGRNDGFSDLANLAQYLSSNSGVDLGHFSGAGMLRDHSAHIEVDSDVAENIINALHQKPKEGSANGEPNTIVCERARQNTERRFSPRPDQRRGGYQRRR